MSKNQDSVTINVKLQGQKEVLEFFDNLSKSINALTSNVNTFTNKIVIQYINKTKEAGAVTKTFNNNLIITGEVTTNNTKINNDNTKSIDNSVKTINNQNKTIKNINQSWEQNNKVVKTVNQNVDQNTKTTENNSKSNKTLGSNIQNVNNIISDFSVKVDNSTKSLNNQNKTEIEVAKRKKEEADKEKERNKQKQDDLKAVELAIKNLAKQEKEEAKIKEDLFKRTQTLFKNEEKSIQDQQKIKDQQLKQDIQNIKKKESIETNSFKISIDNTKKQYIEKTNYQNKEISNNRILYNETINQLKQINSFNKQVSQDKLNLEKEITNSKKRNNQNEIELEKVLSKLKKETDLTIIASLKNQESLIKNKNQTELNLQKSLDITVKQKQDLITNNLKKESDLIKQKQDIEIKNNDRLLLAKKALADLDLKLSSTKIDKTVLQNKLNETSNENEKKGINDRLKLNENYLKTIQKLRNDLDKNINTSVNNKIKEERILYNQQQLAINEKTKKERQLAQELSKSDSDRLKAIRDQQKASNNWSSVLEPFKKAMADINFWFMSIDNNVKKLGNSFVTSASDFDLYSRNVNTLAQLSEEKFKLMQDRVAKMALDPRIKEVPTELMKAMYQVATSGFDVLGNGMKMLETASMAATAGMSDTNTAIKALIGLMKTYKSEGLEDITKFSDEMFITVKYGILTFDELANNMAKANAMASAIGLNFRDSVAPSMITLTRAGLTASQSQVSITNMFKKIISPSEGAGKVAHDLQGLDKDFQRFAKGIDQVNSKGEYQGKALLNVLQKIKEKTHGGDIFELSKLFPEQRALLGVTVLLRNLKDFETQLKHTQNTANATNDALSQMVKTFEFNYKNLLAYVERMKTSFGDILISYLNPIIVNLKSMVDWITSLDKETKEFYLKIGVLVISLSSLLIVLKGVTFVFGVIFNSIKGLTLLIPRLILIVRSLATGTSILQVALGTGGLLGSLTALSIMIPIVIGLLINLGMAMYKMNIEAKGNQFTEYLNGFKQFENATRNAKKSYLDFLRVMKTGTDEQKLEAGKTTYNNLTLELQAKQKQLQDLKNTQIIEQQKSKVGFGDYSKTFVTGVGKGLLNNYGFIPSGFASGFKNVSNLSDQTKNAGNNISKTQTMIDKMQLAIKEIQKKKTDIQTSLNKIYGYNILSDEGSENALNDIQNAKIIQESQKLSANKIFEKTHNDLQIALKKAKDDYEAENERLNAFDSNDPRILKQRKEALIQNRKAYEQEVKSINKEFAERNKKEQDKEQKKQEKITIDKQKEQKLALEKEITQISNNGKEKISTLTKGSIEYLKAVEETAKAEIKVYEKYKPLLSKANQILVDKSIADAKIKAQKASTGIKKYEQGGQEIENLKTSETLLENEYNNRKKLNNLTKAEELKFLNDIYWYKKTALEKEIKLKKDSYPDDLKAIKDLETQKTILTKDYETDRQVFIKEKGEERVRKLQELDEKLKKKTEDYYIIQLKKDHGNLESQKNTINELQEMYEKGFVTEEFYLDKKNALNDAFNAEFEKKESQREKALNKEIKNNKKQLDLYQNLFENVANALSNSSNQLFNNFIEIINNTGKQVFDYLNIQKELSLQFDSLSNKQTDLIDNFEKGIVSLDDYTKGIDTLNESMEAVVTQGSESSQSAIVAIVAFIAKTMVSIISYTSTAKQRLKDMQNSITDITDELAVKIAYTKNMMEEKYNMPVVGGLNEFFDSFKDGSNGIQSLRTQLTELEQEQKTNNLFSSLSQSVNSLTSNLLNMNYQLNQTIENQIAIINNKNIEDQANAMKDYYKAYSDMINALANAGNDQDLVNRISDSWVSYVSNFKQTILNIDNITKQSIQNTQNELNKTIQDVKDTWLKNEYDIALAQRESALNEAKKIQEQSLREIRILDAEVQFNKKRIELLQNYQSERDSLMQKGYDKEVKLTNDFYEAQKKPYEQNIKNINKSLQAEQRIIDDLEKQIKEIGITDLERKRATTQYQTARKTMVNSLNSTFYRQSEESADVSFQSQEENINQQYNKGEITESIKTQKLMDLALKRNIYYQNLADKLVKGTKEQLDYQRKANAEFTNYSNFIFELEKSKIQVESDSHQKIIDNLNDEKTLNERKIEDISNTQNSEIDNLDDRYKDLAGNFKDSMEVIQTALNKTSLSFLNDIKTQVAEINKMAVRIGAGDMTIDRNNTYQADAKTNNTSTPNKSNTTNTTNTNSTSLPQNNINADDFYNETESNKKTTGSGNMYNSTSPTQKQNKGFSIGASSGNQTRSETISDIAIADAQANPNNYKYSNERDYISQRIAYYTSLDEASLKRMAGMFGIPFFKNGGVMQKDGFAYLHANETVIPANHNNSITSINVNVSGNEINANSKQDINNLANIISRQIAKNFNSRIN